MIKAHISKIIQSGGFLGSLLSKIAGPLMKVAVPHAKNILAPLGITAATSAIDAGIQNKIHGSGTTNEEMKDIIKIAQALEDSNILLKGVKNEAKEQKGGFLSVLLDTLGASLLGNLLSGKGIVRAGEGIVRAGYASLIKKNNKFQKKKEYYENEPKFNSVYSGDNLPKTMKNGAYEINIDEYDSDLGTCWIALYTKNNEVIYLDIIFIRHKNIKTNIFRTQAGSSIMCGYFCIGSIGTMFAGKSLIDFTSLFSLYDFKKNDDIILSYFK